jgi:hypothetical protein
MSGMSQTAHVDGLAPAFKRREKDETRSIPDSFYRRRAPANVP